MKTEWDVTRSYIDELVGRAPANLRDEAIELRQRFAALEGERQGASEMLGALAASGATIAIIAGQVERRSDARLQSHCLHCLSLAASLDVRIRKARRTKSKAIDHERDHEIAFKAKLDVIVHGAPLRSAILEAAEHLGITFEGQHADANRDTVYRRIKRLVADPRENIEGAVLIALRRVLARRDK